MKTENDSIKKILQNRETQMELLINKFRISVLIFISIADFLVLFVVDKSIIPNTREIGIYELYLTIFALISVSIIQFFAKRKKHYNFLKYYTVTYDLVLTFAFGYLLLIIFDMPFPITKISFGLLLTIFFIFFNMLSILRIGKKIIIYSGVLTLILNIILLSLAHSPLMPIVFTSFFVVAFTVYNTWVSKYIINFLIVNKSLEEMNQTKNKFFSIIAHDLKNPFNSMLGFSKLLKDNFDNYDANKQKEYIGYIYQEIQQSYKLLENLLLWAQSQKGTIAFNPEKINLLLIVNETCRLLSRMSEKKSIKLLNKIEPTIFIDADKDMISTVIRNLISNAIKFTPTGGEILIQAELKQYHTEISVKDNGIGISEEIQSKLFNISENTSTNGTENETGTGLGLILCKEFIEKHSGKIWVESEIDKGSTFYFTILNK